jgi:hypothetical protein
MATSASTNAMLLADGRVLLLHPADANTQGEIFDAVRGKFQSIATTYYANVQSSTQLGTLLTNGKVFIHQGGYPTIYDPITNTYSGGPSMCCAILIWLRLLPDGRILSRGEEQSGFVKGTALFSTTGLIYDPQTNSTKQTAAVASGPDVLLPSGLVLIAGTTVSATKVGPYVLYDA